MAEHALGTNAVTGHDVAAERGDGAHLRFREIRIAAGVAGVLNLDADGRRVDVALPRPIGHARVPGPHFLGHHLDDAPVDVDDVMARHLAVGARENVERALDIGKPRVVEEQDRRLPPPGPRLDVGRRVEVGHERTVGGFDHRLCLCLARWPRISS